MSRILFGLLCSSLLFSNSSHPNSPPFEGANLISATNLEYPVQSIAVGTVVLEIRVSENGTVEDVRPIREIQSLTGMAVQSVKQWRFKPAVLNDRPTRSRTVVAVTFNPVDTVVHDVPLPPLSETKPLSPAIIEPIPIEVVAAAFPRYPYNSVTTGTVVLRVSVGTDGRVEKAVAVRDVPSLTGPCLDVLKKWRFEPAEFRGQHIPSSIGLAFVLRPPNGK
jgi:outer membrane biosynthesis protein TonB